jgi:hypothetical protein
MTGVRKKRLQNFLILLSAASQIFLVGCFKGGQLATTPTISITLSPSSTNVIPGQSVTVMASVYDQSGQGATWTISPLNFGALSKQTTTSVVYTPPANFSRAATITITATSIANPLITSSVQISATPNSVNLTPFAAQTLNQAQQLPIFGNDILGKGVTWMLSPASGAGTLSGSTSFSVTYFAPAIVTAPMIATVTATSASDPNVFASLQITVFPSGAGNNVAALNVNGGPVPGQVNPNRAYTSVSICNVGSSTGCQTVGGILVDTGSYGLRILQSQIPLLHLSNFVDGLGNILENCTSRPDGSFLWGPVSTADIWISGETASSIPIQVISSLQNEVIPTGCANGATGNQNTAQLLGANGILGIGPEPTDCTVSGMNFCDGSVQPVPPNKYYSCPKAGCGTGDSPVIVTHFQQVENPVAVFGADQNGVILQLPPVSDHETSVTGTLIFGIGTEPNNALGSATVFTMDANDHFTTVFNGQTLSSSFIDSGSSGLFFPDSLPACADHPQYFCPSSLTNLSAVNKGATQGNNTVPFSVTNADDLFSLYPNDAVFSSLAGPETNTASCPGGTSSCAFDWGLPFFYGRTVYTAIDGQVVFGAPTTPWWAY